MKLCNILMFDDTIEIFTILVCFLPADSIHWTGSDGIIYILSFIGFTVFHDWESLVIEFEDIPRNRSTSATTNTCAIHMRFSDFLQGIQGVGIHRRIKRDKMTDKILRIIKKCLLFARITLPFFFFSMNLQRIYDYSFRILIVILPFMTFLSVFTSQKLWIPGVSFLKEWLLLAMLLCLFVLYIRWKMKIQWTKYDFLIWTYILLLSLITLFTTGISGLVYGGRYDFEFLVTFFVVFHGFSLLSRPTSYYVKLFLISGWIALFLGMLLKWPLSEDILLYFGYSGNPSNWQFGSAVPIFHGVEWANIRRFQGLFDGPNTMWAFLLLYIGIFTYYFRNYKKWHFFIGGIVLIFVACIIYTYSRSALLGFVGGVWFIILFSARYLYQHFPKQTISLFIIALFGIGAIFLQYGGNINAIIERGWSSKWHAERMVIGIKRVISNPIGQWLGSAGPAYRHVLNLEGKSRTEIEQMDVKYIPESWYIQQFIEGGFLWGIIFLILMLFILFWLFRVHVILFGMFTSILIMNLFLHTFESSMLVLSLFIIIGLYLASYSSRWSHASR